MWRFCDGPSQQHAEGGHVWPSTEEACWLVTFLLLIIVRVASLYMLHTDRVWLSNCSSVNYWDLHAISQKRNGLWWNLVYIDALASTSSCACQIFCRWTEKQDGHQRPSWILLESTFVAAIAQKLQTGSWWAWISMTPFAPSCACPNLRIIGKRKTNKMVIRRPSWNLKLKYIELHCTSISQNLLQG